MCIALHCIEKIPLALYIRYLLDLHFPACKFFNNVRFRSCYMGGKPGLVPENITPHRVDGCSWVLLSETKITELPLRLRCLPFFRQGGGRRAQAGKGVRGTRGVQAILEMDQTPYATTRTSSRDCRCEVPDPYFPPTGDHIECVIDRHRPVKLRPSSV